MTEISKVPAIRFNGFVDAWEQRKLGDIGDITKLAGFEFTKYVSYSDEGEIIALRGLNVKNGGLILDEVKYIDKSDFSKLNRSKLYKNDILLTYVGTVGQLALVPQDDKYYLAPNVARIRMDKTINPLFVSQQMSSFTFYNKVILPLIATSSQPALSMENVRKFMIWVPNEAEQDLIGHFFKQLDDTIALHQSKLLKLKNIKKAMLEKMFPKNGSTIPEIRFAGFTEPWEQHRFGALAQIRRGLTYSPANVRNDGVRVLRSSNINGDTFVLKDDDVFVEPKAVNIDFVKENDILITAANGSSRLVGKHALVKNTGRKVVHGGFMLVATAEEPEFINSLMSSQWYEKFINIYVAGGNGAIGNLSKSDLEEQSIIAPIVSEQKRIGKFFGCLDNLITIHQSKIEKLQNIKKACLENMFI